MRLHEKLQYKLRNFIYEQERRKPKESKSVNSDPIGVNQEGIKGKLSSALDEMDGYLEEKLQGIQLPKFKR